MEKQLNFALKLSLEELALRSVVVNLWNEKDILSRIQNFPFKASGYFESWQDHAKWKETVEGEVNCQVFKLLLPESLKKRMVNVVSPIGHQILRWKSCHEELGVPVLEQLCWKSIGAIDYLKTAQKLIRLETIVVAKRYRLACWYCLEDYIPRLWEALPEEYKRSFRFEFSAREFKEIEDKAIQFEDKLSLDLLLDLEYYWTCFLNAKDYLEMQRYFSSIAIWPYVRHTPLSLFRTSACAGNKAATEYFFQKLTDEERESSLFDTVCYVMPENNHKTCEFFGRKKRCDVFCYLLSVLTPEQQIQVLEKYPRYVLAFFLFLAMARSFLGYRRSHLGLSSRK